MGVEEEFLLTGSSDPATVPRAASVLAKVAAELGQHAEPEFYRTQVETSTTPCGTGAQIRKELAEARRVLADAAGELDARLVASATAVTGTTPPPIADDPRYQAMARRYRDVLAAVTTETCGCHVHLGPFDRDAAVLLGTLLRPWLPMLEALAANSPFAGGRDCECASWRHFEFARWPTVGPSPVLDGPGYERTARDLMADGTVMDRKMIYWYARPSERWPTLEIRVADVNADLDVPVLLALLARGLAQTLLGRLRSDKPVPGPGDDRRLRRDHRAAALYGLGSDGTDPVDGTTASLPDRVASLVEFAAPGLRAAGDLETAQAMLAGVLERGGGAGQQRDDYRVRGSFADVVDGLAERTAAV
jgi:carboxylate-amine ligase